MPHFETRRRVHHSAADMFELVADIERYPEFVPLCQAMKIRRREKEGACDAVVATMTVSYKVFHESFTSRVVLDRDAGRIHVSYLDGPFRFLENRWTFKDAGNDACDVGFTIAYEFRSRLLASVMGAIFDRAFRKFATAFEARADQIYGKASPASPAKA